MSSSSGPGSSQGNKTSGSGRPANASATSNPPASRRQPASRAASTPGSSSTTARPSNGPSTNTNGGGESAGPRKLPENVPAHKKHRQNYLRLVNLIKNRKEAKPRIFVFTDVEQDYDDLMAVIFLAEMHRMGAIELVGFVANHYPAEARARFLRTVLHLVGLGHLPIAVGTHGTPDLAKHGGDFYYSLKNTTFHNAKWNNEKFPAADTLIPEILMSYPKVTALMLSSLQDIGEFFDRQDKTGDFMKNNFAKFVSQGGYEVEVQQLAQPGNGNSTAARQNGKSAQASNNTKPKVKVALKPVTNMANNSFHPAQAANYTNHLAAHKLTSDTWSREAAKAAKLPGSFMEQLFQYGPIGAHLEWMWMRQEFKFYWDPFNWPFMPHLGVDWYLTTRLGLDLTKKEDKETFEDLRKTGLSFNKAVPMIKVIAYDGCAAVGAVGDDFMRAMGILDAESNLPEYNRPDLAGHPHRVFGKKPDDLGGINDSRLASVLETFLLGSLMATTARAEKLIPRATVEHSHVSPTVANIPLFLEKVKVQNNRSQAEAAMKSAEKVSGETKESYLAQAAALTSVANDMEVKIKKAERTNKWVAPTRAQVPYEQLYQAAMTQAAAPAKTQGQGKGQAAATGKK
ncbi:hypothetical protein B0I37DRAFT_300264 [Chaetomium sp. MPI-CAGE-AT-0009]|nr:hypothetical protein B0I37DRAFT_300264 [Chaetomium sp. MPI-CAGE-AT-0009]